MTYLFPSVKELPCSPDPNDATYLPLISSSCTVTKCMCVCFEFASQVVLRISHSVSLSLIRLFLLSAAFI